MYLMTDFIAPTCKAGHDGGRVHILSAMSHSTSRAKPPAPNLDKVPLHGASGLDDATPSRQLLSQRRDIREAG